MVTRSSVPTVCLCPAELRRIFVQCIICDDPTGRALEVVAVRLPDCLLVVHVQDLQAKFRHYYDQAREEE